MTLQSSMRLREHRRGNEHLSEEMPPSQACTPGIAAVRQGVPSRAHSAIEMPLPNPVHTATLLYNHVVKTAATVISLAAATVLGAGAVRAEGERALSVSVGWATFSAPGKPVGRQAPPTLRPDIGGTASVAYEHSISDDFALRGELAGGVFYGGGPNTAGKTSFAGLGDAGVVFRFDVLKYVPYAYAGLGGVLAGGGPIDRNTDFALVLGGGLDWLQSRERSYGLEARVASFGGDITLVTVGLRGTTRWGFL